MSHLRVCTLDRLLVHCIIAVDQRVLHVQHEPRARGHARRARRARERSRIMRDRRRACTRFERRARTGREQEGGKDRECAGRHQGYPCGGASRWTRPLICLVGRMGGRRTRRRGGGWGGTAGRAEESDGGQVATDLRQRVAERDWSSVNARWRHADERVVLLC